MRSRFNSDYYKGLREDLVEEVTNEYIKDGMSSDEAREKAEDDTPTPYDLWEDEMQYQAEIQYELYKDRELGL